MSHLRVKCGAEPVCILHSPRESVMGIRPKPIHSSFTHSLNWRVLMSCGAPCNKPLWLPEQKTESQAFSSNCSLYQPSPQPPRPPARRSPLPEAPVPCLLLVSPLSQWEVPGFSLGDAQLRAEPFQTKLAMCVPPCQWQCSLHPWSFAISSQPSTRDPLDLLSSPQGPHLTTAQLHQGWGA